MRGPRMVHLQIRLGYTQKRERKKNTTLRQSTCHDADMQERESGREGEGKKEGEGGRGRVGVTKGRGGRALYVGSKQYEEDKKKSRRAH